MRGAIFSATSKLNAALPFRPMTFTECRPGSSLSKISSPSFNSCGCPSSIVTDPGTKSVYKRSVGLSEGGVDVDAAVPFSGVLSLGVGDLRSWSSSCLSLGEIQPPSSLHQIEKCCEEDQREEQSEIRRSLPRLRVELLDIRRESRPRQTSAPPALCVEPGGVLPRARDAPARFPSAARTLLASVARVR